MTSPRIRFPSHRTLETAKPAAKAYPIALGDALTCMVLANGKKRWIYRFRIDGKASIYTIGYFPSVTIAQAKAEERRAMAVALEQEMKARNVEMRAKVIEAEAEVPKAIAEAFRSGQLGVMDYYKMENVKADTSMRDSIANSEKDTKDSGGNKSEKK